MTMEALFNNVENAILQYKQACDQEEMLYGLIRDAERELERYNSQASSSEDPSAQKAALQQMRDAAMRLQQYQNELQRARVAKEQAQRYLVATRSELTNVIRSIEEKLPKFDQSISTFELMAGNPFGQSAAAQLPNLRAKREEYQRNLNDAYTLIDRIDSALSGNGTLPQRVLRR